MVEGLLRRDVLQDMSSPSRRGHKRLKSKSLLPQNTHDKILDPTLLEAVHTGQNELNKRLSNYRGSRTSKNQALNAALSEYLAALGKVVNIVREKDHDHRLVLEANLRTLDTPSAERKRRLSAPECRSDLALCTNRGDEWVLGRKSVEPVLARRSVESSSQLLRVGSRFVGHHAHTLQGIMAGGEGHDYKQYNQDRCLIIQLNGGAMLYAMFDGHGDCGHLVSDICRQRLAALASGFRITERTDIRIVKNWLRRYFDSVHTELLQLDFATYSGTTATLVVALHDKMIIAWVGDSKAVLYGEDGKSVHFEEIYDHCASHHREAERVAKHGSTVSVAYLHGLKKYVYRINECGLAMTRALGDNSAIP